MSTGGASGEAITIRSCWVVSELLLPHPPMETIARNSATTPAHLPTFLLQCKLLFIKIEKFWKLGCGACLRTMCWDQIFWVGVQINMVSLV
jgi:hypothetical protein